MAYAKLLDRIADQHSDGTAFVRGDRRRTWAEVRSGVARIAGGVTQLGIGAGDRVAIISRLDEPQAEFACALSWAGVIWVPLNIRLAADELVTIVRDADVSAIAFDAVHAGLAATIAEKLGIARRIDLDGDDPSSLHALGRASPIARVEQADDDIGMLIYTGGTTGIPKGVMQPIGSLIEEGDLMRERLGYNRESVYLHGMTMFHVAGVAQFIGVTLAGGTHVFRPDGGPAQIMEEIARRGVNMLCGAPTSIAMMLDHPSRDDALLRTIRGFGYGASPISEALLARAIAAMPNAGFAQFYGQSEACGTLIALDREWHVLEGPRSGKLRTAGLPDRRYEIKIVNESGIEQPRGAPGEIVARGAFLSLGYWRQPEKTAALFEGGWLHTGDVGIMDEDGFVSVVDRHKDMIVSGGENVFSSEVENALASHSAVASCAVIAVPHPLWGEAVHAIVTLVPGCDADERELIAHCRTLIAGYKCPKTVEITTTPLPLSGVGKVMKHVLRTQYLERQQAAI